MPERAVIDDRAGTLESATLEERARRCECTVLLEPTDVSVPIPWSPETREYQQWRASQEVRVYRVCRAPRRECTNTEERAVHLECAALQEPQSVT